MTHPIVHTIRDARDAGITITGTPLALKLSKDGLTFSVTACPASMTVTTRVDGGAVLRLGFKCPDRLKSYASTQVEFALEALGFRAA